MKSVCLISVGSVGEKVLGRLNRMLDLENKSNYVFHFTNSQKFLQAVDVKEYSYFYIVIGPDVKDFYDVYKLVKYIKIKYGNPPIGIFFITRYYRAFKTNYLLREISKVSPFFFLIGDGDHSSIVDTSSSIEDVAKTIKYSLILDTIVYDKYELVNISIESFSALRIIYYSNRFNVIKLFSSNRRDLVSDPVLWGKKIINAINELNNSVQELTLHIFVNNRLSDYITVKYIGNLLSTILSQVELNRLTWSATVHENIEDMIAIETIFS